MTWRRRWPYVAAVCAMPLIVLWHRDNALYTAPSYADPWFYLGYFRHLTEFKREMFYGFYYGSRLSWLLPGAMIHAIFPPAFANATLHLVVQLTATLSFFSILSLMIGARSALLATMVFAVNPWLWVATGWDYPDGAGIAYCLLAIALLTRSAVRPGSKWTLIAAGAALAGMVYSHIFLGTLTPLLLFYYCGLAGAWQRTTAIASIRNLGVWAGTGFAIVTGFFCGVNYFLDGQFWFYGPSVSRAVSMAKDFQFVRSIWLNHELAPWLWPAVAGSIIAIVLILNSARSVSWPRNAPALLFSGQLLLAVFYMSYLQSRGTTVLGHYPYVSYLLPFVFLVMGISFWQAAQKMRLRTYLLICSFAVVAFAALWYSAQGPLLPASRAAQYSAAGMSACALATAFILRERIAGCLLAVAGFAGLTAVSLAHTVNLDGLNLHGSRIQYQRIMEASHRIDTIRKRRPVRFWFDRREPNFFEYEALNGIYLEEFSQTSSSFPHGCDEPIDPSALVVALSQQEPAAETARAALDDCWLPFGVRPVVDSVEQVRRGKGLYTMTILRVEARPPAAYKPEDLIAEVPLQSLMLAAPGVSFEQWSGGLEVTTRSDFGAFAARAPLGLDPHREGKFSVFVRARILAGKVGFGILDSSGRRFLVERFMWPLPSISEVILPLPSPPAVGDFVLDNRTTNTTASTALIEKIEIRKTP